MVNPAEVTAYLHEEIPVTRAMAIDVIAWDGAIVTLAAPLAPNQNHTDTAFGGSISTLGILAGYCLLHLLFQERQLSTRILIQKTATDYLRPIDDAMTATAAVPTPVLLAEFLQTMQRKRRARITVESQIRSRNMVAATHTGLFVAMVY